MRQRPWPLHVFVIEFKKILAYRADFWVHFLLPTLTHLFVGYFLWLSIFENRSVRELEGFTFPQMVLYYLLVPLVDRIVFGANWIGFMSREIYEGTLTRYLIYPISFFGYKLIAHLAQATIAVTQLIGALLLYSWWVGLPPSLEWSALQCGMIALNLGLSLLVLFMFLACCEMLAFWADNVWSLVVTVRFGVYFLGGGMVPLTFFPELAQSILAFTPFPYFLSMPIRTFLGQVSVNEWINGIGILLFWGLIGAGVLRALWKRGNLQYTGVGM